MLPFKPDRLRLAQLPTPFRPLDRISALLGGPRIWLKHDDCTGSALTGNKLRKLEFVIAEALRQGCDTLITCGGVQSNHCRATALAGAQLGLKTHLLLRGDSPAVLDGNHLLDTLAGAGVSIYPSSQYVAQEQSLFQHWVEYYQSQGRKPYCIPTGASDEVGIWGYIQAAEELQQDFITHNLNPDAVVCATGSGGTQAGLGVGFYLLNSDMPVFGVAVCDSKQHFHDKITGDVGAWCAKWQQQAALVPWLDALPEALNIQTLDQYVGPGYAQVYPEVLDCIKLLAREEGVVLDPVYTAKAFHGLMSEVQNGLFSSMDNIVFVHTGGVFGLFPYRTDFSAPPG